MCFSAGGSVKQNKNRSFSCPSVAVSQGLDGHLDSERLLQKIMSQQRANGAALNLTFLEWTKPGRRLLSDWFYKKCNHWRRQSLGSSDQISITFMNHQIFQVFLKLNSKLRTKTFWKIWEQQHVLNVLQRQTYLFSLVLVSYVNNESKF